MTKDELFKDFDELFKDFFSMYAPPLDLAMARQRFERLIAPYLSVPRSLQDDPPKEEQEVYIINGFSNVIGSGPFHGKDWFDRFHLHWIPRIRIPQPDNDEQEFEEFWSHCIDANRAHKEIAKHSWMAARGRVRMPLNYFDQGEPLTTS